MSVIPKIRFKGFTDDWEQRKLGEVVEFYNGDRSSRYPNDVDMVSEGIPFINAGDLVSGRVKLDTANKITVEKYNELSGAKIQHGDIIYCLRGTLGKNAFVDNFSIGTVASSLVDIRPRKIVGKYLFQVLNSDIEYRQRTINDEGAAQPNLSAKNLSLFDIPMPDEAEQTKIAEYFDNLDNLITLHQRKCDETKELKKYMLQKMFPKKGEKVPEIRFEGFTDNWEQRKLSQVVDSIDTGKSKYDILEQGEYEILGSTGQIGYDNAYDYDGDFLLTARVGANAGTLYRHSGKVKITDNTVFLQGNQIDFIFYLLDKFDLKRLSFGSGQPLIKASELKNLELQMPTSKEEKDKIANYFLSLDHLITLHQCKCDTLKELKKYMLQNMFPKEG